MIIVDETTVTLEGTKRGIILDVVNVIETYMELAEQNNWKASIDDIVNFVKNDAEEPVLSDE